MEPDWSLSYCWKRFFHCWMKRSRAEKPYTSMRPDLVLSNVSEEEQGVRSGARVHCRNSQRAQDLCMAPQHPALAPKAVINQHPRGWYETVPNPDAGTSRGMG